jgi:hypothetical protein
MIWFDYNNRLSYFIVNVLFIDCQTKKEEEKISKDSKRETRFTKLLSDATIERTLVIN